MKRIDFIFVWRDFRVGVYWNRTFSYLYIAPLPMFTVRIDFNARPK